MYLFSRMKAIYLIPSYSIPRTVHACMHAEIYKKNLLLLFLCLLLFSRLTLHPPITPAQTQQPACMHCGKKKNKKPHAWTRNARTHAGKRNARMHTKKKDSQPKLVLSHRSKKDSALRYTHVPLYIPM